MAVIFKGAPVAVNIKETLKERLEKNQESIGLGLIRMGAQADDISYQNSIVKQAEEVGVKTRIIEIPNDISSKEATSLIEELNRDFSIDGVLVFRPMSNSKIEELIREKLSPQKDVDGITKSSMAMQYSGFGNGFYPCTAEACMKILSYYEVDLEGKKVVVIGRSQVIGKPLAMMMLGQNATVTICHSKTEKLAETVKQGDIIIAAIGKSKFISEDYLNHGQIVIDVGINFNNEGKLSGDVDFAAAENIVKAITPVPGGVGNVTTALLLAHTFEAKKRSSEIG